MTDCKAWVPYTVGREQSPGNTCRQLPANGHLDIT